MPIIRMGAIWRSRFPIFLPEKNVGFKNPKIIHKHTKPMVTVTTCPIPRIDKILLITFFVPLASILFPISARLYTYSRVCGFRAATISMKGLLYPSSPCFDLSFDLSFDLCLRSMQSPFAPPYCQILSHMLESHPVWLLLYLTLRLFSRHTSLICGR